MTFMSGHDIFLQTIEIYIYFNLFLKKNYVQVEFSGEFYKRGFVEIQ